MRVKIQPSLNGFTRTRSFGLSRKEEERDLAAHALIQINPKGIMMTGLRFVATALLAFVLCLAWDGGGHSAFAQSRRAPRVQERPPVGAPTGAPAEAAPLAAPAGTVDADV